jgi:hypothetical protein
MAVNTPTSPMPVSVDAPATNFASPSHRDRVPVATVVTDTIAHHSASPTLWMAVVPTCRSKVSPKAAEAKTITATASSTYCNPSFVVDGEPAYRRGCAR